MPASNRDGAFLYGFLKLRPSFKKLFLLSAFVLTLALSVLPATAFADDQPLSDPTGRGWECSGDMHQKTGFTTVANIGTRTCHPEGDTTQTWQETCTENGVVQELLGIGDKAVDCRICVTNEQGQQCYQGDYVTYTLFGYQDHHVDVDQTTGAPTGEVSDGEQSSPVSWAFAQLGRLTLEAVATIVWFITQMLVWAALAILAVVGSFFNFVTTEFVIEMGKYITAPNATAVRTAWSLIRDLANIAIIGGLVAIAIGTIIGSEKYSIQKSLARLLIAALLVNFSYFFAGAIIDFSNFTARAAYQAVICQDSNCGIASRIAEITDFDQLSDFGVKFSRLTNPAYGAAGAITDSLTLTDDARNQLNETATPSANATYNIMLLIFICVTTFVFLSAIALLVGRFVVLIFLLITSPIGIAGGSIPLLDKYAKEWWTAMWNQAMFAPVYFLLAGLSLNILDQFKEALLTPNADGLLNAFAGQSVDRSLQQIVGIVSMFVVAIGFMWTALSTAKKMSAEGGERFADIYKATGAAFGWAPKAYTGGLKYLGGAALRETFGQAAYRAGQYYPEVANRIQDWSKNSRIGKVLTKTPGLGAVVRAAARGADRATQGLLDKTGDQKFLGVAGYKSIYDAKLARKAKLEETKKDLENKDQDSGKEAEKHLAEEEKKLKEGEAGRIAEIARLEALKKAGTLNTADEKKLDDLRHDQALLARINDFKAQRAKHPKDGVTDDHGELVEGATLAQLEAERRKLLAKGPLNSADTNRLAEINQQIKEEKDFEKQKDEFNIGGAQGAERRAKNRHERALAAGEKLDSVNEKARAQDLEGRNGDLNASESAELRRLEEQQDADPEGFANDPVRKANLEQLSARAYLSQSQEKAYVDALQTPESERTDEQKAALEAYNRGKATSFEKEERAFFRAKTKPLSADDQKTLSDFRDKRKAGQLTDPKDIKKMVVLEEREKATPFSATEQSTLTGLRAQRTNGTLTKEGKAMLAVMEERERLIPTGGLSTSAQENTLTFRSRQKIRTDGLGRDVFRDEDGNLKVEDLSAYRYRSETSDKTGFRAARGERERIMGNFSPEFIKKEYEKNPQRILQYATALSSDAWLKIADDHTISEDIRNKMWAKRMGFWGGGMVEVYNDLQSGKLVKGSKEYEEKMLDYYNWVTKYVPNKEFVRSLQEDAVIGELPNGEHIRLKDLNDERFRPLTWNASSSTAFADAKDARIYGTNQTSEIARAKRGATDRIRDLDAAMYMMQGLSDKDQFLTNVAGTVQYDAKTRATNTIKKVLDESNATIRAFETPGDRGNLTTEDYAAALRNKRVAELHQETLRGNGPLNNVINHVASFDQPGGKNREGKTREDYKRKMLADINGIEESAVTNTEITAVPDNDPDLDTYLKVKAVAEHRAGNLKNADGTKVDISADQQLVYETQKNIERSAPEWFEGKNDREAKAVLNKRSLHSIATYKGVQPDQIPELLDKQDGSEVTKFWEGMLTFRNRDEVLAMINNPRIGQTFKRPTPKVMRRINVARTARGEPPIVLEQER